MRFNKNHVHVSLMLIVACFCLGCEPSKKKPPAAGGQTGTAGPSATAAQYKPDVGANQILAATVQRYRQAKTYQDRAILSLSYTLNGQRLDEPKRWSTKYSSAGMLATELFNTKIHGNGKILGCEIFDIETANLDNQTLAIPYGDSFGRNIAGGKNQIPLNVLFRDPIARNFVAGFSELPLEPKYEATGPWLVPPPMSLLTGQIANPWVETPEQTERLTDQKIASKSCYVVRSLARGLSVDIWIDQKEMVIAKMSLPLKLLADEVVVSDEVTDVVLEANFHEAIFDAPLVEADFKFEPRLSAVLVRKLVSLPEAMPSEMIGQTAPKFRLLTPTGKTRDRRFFDGKTTVLVWLSGLRSIQTATKLKQVFKSVGDRDFEHGIVFSDTDTQKPGSGQPSPSAAIADLSRLLAVPAYYDRQHTVSSQMKIKSVPAAVLLDGDGRIQFVTPLAGDDWGVRLAAAIKRVAAGDDVGQEMRTAYERYLDTYHQQLAAVSAQSLVRSPTKNRNNPTGVSSQSSRLKIRPKKRWELRNLKQPGNIVGIPTTSGARFAIFDGQQTLAMLDDSGKLLGRQKLELNKDEPATTVRAITSQGKTWLAVFSVLGQRVHLLDQQLKQQAVFPTQAGQAEPIVDVQFYAQSNQPPQLLVAWQDGGVESYDLKSNDSMVVSKLSCESLGAVGSVLAGVANGRAQTMAGDEHTSQDGIQFVRLSASNSQLLGVGQTAQGKWTAIGLDEKMSQVWAIETGPQLHESFVSPIANAKLASGQTIWAIADSNRMVHLVSGAGQWLGEFEAEGEVSGLCLQLVGGKMLIAISTTAGVECWDLGL